MSVYVDESVHPYGRMMMCHMIADSTDELMAMAAKIRVAQKWLQQPGKANEHFDVCKSKRALAVGLGAIEVSNREMGRMTLERRRQQVRERPLEDNSCIRKLDWPPRPSSGEKEEKL